MNKEQQRAQPGGYPYQRKDKQNNMVAAPFKVRKAPQPDGCAYQGNIKKLRIYLAGKITGCPIEEVKAKFEQAEKILASSYNVINPTKIVPSDANWEQAMAICLGYLIDCDAIYMLPDWKDSRGARLEYAIALKFEKTILFSLPSEFINQG